VAGLSDAELEELIAGDLSASEVGGGVVAAGAEDEEARAEAIFDTCLAAVRRLDGRAFELELERASVELSRTHLIEKVLEPLMRTVGELWRVGELRPAHEHMASAGMRSFVGGLCDICDTPEAAPRIVITTPQRQRHEMGALLVAASAAAEGWNVVYLGPDLPAEEIAAAARDTGARAIGLSITYPPDDPSVAGELTRLGRLLPPHVTLLVGGRGAPAYRSAIDAAGGRFVEDLASLRGLLAGLRDPESSSLQKAARKIGRR
jgi:methanogenic corrinoid protein MtbC1